jgi:hypothetical protein
LAKLQKWPTVDDYHEVELTVKANNAIIGNLKVKNGELNKMTEEQALFIALNQKEVVKYLTGLKILGTNWFIYKDYEGVITINVDRTAEAEKRKEIKTEKRQKTN